MIKNKNIKWSAVDPSNLDLKGMTVAILGGTGGIGRALSRFAASRGADVTVVGQTFRDADHARIKFVEADLSLMKDAQRVAHLLLAETLDLVIFTTGIFAAPKRQETAEGIERDIAVSYLSRLVIMREIVPRLGKHRANTKMKPRIFIMGFPGTGQIGNYDDLNAENSYKAMSVHMNTVAGNEMLVLDGATHNQHVNFFGLNPGIIRTNIRSNFFGKNSIKSRVIESIIGLLTISPQTYAKRIMPLLVSQDIEKYNGAMFNQKGQAIMPSEGLSSSHREAFIAASEELLKRFTSA